MFPPLAVTFDLDGTLARIGTRRLALWPGMLRHPRTLLRYTRAVEALRGQRSADLDHEIAKLIARRTHAPVERVAGIMDEWIDRRWPTAFAGALPPPGVAQLIDACDRRGIPRAVVSDHPAIDKLAAMGIGGWTAVVSCRTLGALKPLPDGLHAAAAQLGVAVQGVLHVGDRPDTDGAMAAAAGADFLDVASLALAASEGMDLASMDSLVDLVALEHDGAPRWPDR